MAKAAHAQPSANAATGSNSTPLYPSKGLTSALAFLRPQDFPSPRGRAG